MLEQPKDNISVHFDRCPTPSTFIFVGQRTSKLKCVQVQVIRRKLCHGSKKVEVATSVDGLETKNKLRSNKRRTSREKTSSRDRQLAGKKVASKKNSCSFASNKLHDSNKKLFFSDFLGVTFMRRRCAGFEDEMARCPLANSHSAIGQQSEKIIQTCGIETLINSRSFWHCTNKIVFRRTMPPSYQR